MIWDKANCTYWWIIDLQPQFQQPTKQMIGYSKVNGEPEAIDKNDWLMSRIEMFYKYPKNGPNWLKRSNFIQIFERKGPLPSVSNDQLILTLYPKGFVIGEGYTIRSEVNNFLKNFYARIIQGLPPERNMRPRLRKTKSRDELLNFQKKDFKTAQELYDYCDKLKASGEAEGAVNHAKNQYLQKHFNRLLNN